MSTKLRYASAFSVAVSFITILFGAGGSGASAQELSLPDLSEISAPQFTAEPVVQAVVQPASAEPAAIAAEDGPDADTLAELVAEHPVPEQLSPELECLAGAIYFESKGETLAGQLAVGRVVVARSESGRFPPSYCGVVYQPSQFSFVRGRSMPAIPRSSRNWQTAMKIAQIAHDGSWKSPVEGALFFHARHVSPGWRLKRLASVDNHVFYR